MFDLSAAVGLLASHSATVRRPNASTYATNGIANAQTFISYTVARVSVQPLRGEDLNKAPEGSRTSSLVSLHAAFEFFTSDRVTVSGLGVFEVFHVEPWNAHGNFSKAMARQLDAGEPRS